MAQGLFGSNKAGYASSQKKRIGKATWWGGADQYAGAEDHASYFGGNGVEGQPKKPSLKSGPQQPDYYRDKTDQERTALKLKQGIAPTAKNMGSLGVQYRADEDTAHAAGEQSVGDKRAMKVIDTRTADDYKYNVTGPENVRVAAAAEAIRKRKQESSAMGRAWDTYARGPRSSGNSSSHGSSNAVRTSGSSSFKKTSSKSSNTRSYLQGGLGADEKALAKEKARVAGYGLFPKVRFAPTGPR